MMGQWIAMSMQQVTQTFLVYYLTGSPAILGTTALATGVPQILLLLFGGAWADRFQKKRLLQFGQIGGSLSALIILAALLTGYMSKDNPACWWLIILTSVISGICNGVALPARQAMIPELVPPEKVMNAVALNSIGQNSLALVGPTVAGFLIAGLGFTWVYFFMAVFYMVAVVMNNFIPPVQVKVQIRRNTLKDVVEGVKYVYSNKLIFAIVAFNLLCIVTSMPRGQLMPIFATDILHVGASGQGILQSAGAVGSVLAALVYASLPPRRRGLMMLIAGINLGLALAVFSFSHNYALSIFMMVMCGIGQTGHSNMATIMVQGLTDKEHLGRTMSILQMGSASANLGTFVIGVIAEFAGAPWTMAVMGMILFFSAVSCMIFLSSIRKLD
jgi:MFS family permease